MRARWLDPAGTASARLRGRTLVTERFTERARAIDLEDRDLFLAEELAALVPDIPEDERGSLTLLVLASMAHHRRGSTRLPLDDHNAVGEPSDDAPSLDESVRSTLRSLGATAQDEHRVARLVRQARTQVRAGEGPLTAIFGAPEQYRPLLLSGPHLYHQRLWDLEARVGQALRTRLEAPPRLDERTITRVLRDIETSPPSLPSGGPMRLNDEQRAAVVAALTNDITVISGGPGTGKTSILVSILRCIARLPDPPLDAVALTAPTGKAADRMRESVDRALRNLERPGLDDRNLVSLRPNASTLHRLLGYAPRSGRYRHHANNPLSARFLLVDESSMIDVVMMERLLSALPAGGQLVLLGDGDQLPAVESGAVFRDLSVRGGPSVVSLRKSYRMNPKAPAGRHILVTAERIRNRGASALFEATSTKGEEPPVRARQTPSDVEHQGVEWLDPRSPTRREVALRRWYEACVESRTGLSAELGRTWTFDAGRIRAAEEDALGDLLSHYERSRILCLTRQRSTGVEAINSWFHTRIGTRTSGDATHRAPFSAGEPVIVRRNDYDRGLFNGDSGLVLWTTDGEGDSPRLAAVFRKERTFLAYPLDMVGHLLELAWAITVHKSQGSEYAHVAIVLPTSETPLLSRELLYTAVTRSSRSVLLIGPRSMIESCVLRSVERSSGIAEQLG